MSVSVTTRASAVALAAFAVLGVFQSSNTIRAQSTPMRWDGLLEGISVRSGDFWMQPEPADGANRATRHAISADGRYVLFQSMAPDLGSYYNWYTFLRDRHTGQNTMLFGNESLDPVLSGDGNQIAFTICDQWMRPDGQPICDVYGLSFQPWWMLHNLSEAANGTLSDANSAEPVLSSNGRFVVFRTSSSTLLPPGAGPDQIVIRDRDADQNGILDEPGTAVIETVSVSSIGEAGNGPSSTAEVSDDGRFIAFRSGASNLVTGDTNGVWDLFLRDRVTGVTRRINVRPWGDESTTGIDVPAISMTPDGQFIAYSSSDGLLAAGAIDDYNNFEDVFVYDVAANWTTRLDVGWGPPIASGYIPGNGPTRWPTLSADGRYVSMQTDASNLEIPSAYPVTQVVVYDRLLQKPTRISIKPDQSDPDRESVRPQISADGSVVMFTSPASNLMAGVPPLTDELYAAVHLEVSPEEVVVPGRGGSASFNVTAQQHTRWTAMWDWNQWWFQAELPPFGVGDGTMAFVARDANPDPTARSMTVTVNQAHSVVVTQEPGISVTSISPTSGPMTGGTQVTVRGTGFEPDSRVVFDGYDAASAQFVDSTTMIATTPAHVPGIVWVAVFTSDFRAGWINQAFEFVDTTPPTLTPVIYSGTLGKNGWYVTDVSFYFWAEDPDSPITVWEGCESTTISSDTAGTTFSCTVTSAGGSTSSSITIKRDVTPPGGIIHTPLADYMYKRWTYHVADYVCGDATSGIATCMGQSPNGQPLQTNVTGHYKFDVWAEDRAGNITIISRNYDVSSGQCEQRPYGLAGWWPGDGHYRDIVAGHDGVLVNGTPNFYASPFSMGMAFINNAHLRVPEAEVHRMGDAFTLSAWVYLVRDWLNPVSVVAGREGEYLLARGADGMINFSIANADPGWGWVSTGIPFEREKWMKLALTYDGSRIRLYKNGTLVYSQNGIGTIGDQAPAQNDFMIAARQNSSEPSYFDGSIDDVEIVNRAMSATEIDQAYLSADLGLCQLTTILQFAPPTQHGTFGSAAELAAVLTNFTGQPIAGEQVHFTFRGLFAGTAVTDAGGRATVPVSISGLFAGTYANAAQAAHPATAYLKYSNANANFVIDKAAPAITWAAPAPIAYGTALGSQQLNGSSTVAGTFAYSPASGAILAAGSHRLTTTFTPSSSNYTQATASVPLTVVKATPTVNVIGGSFIYDGAAHAATGTATGIGGASLGSLTFTYNGASEPPLSAGVYNVVGTFAGDDNYEAATGSAILTIGKATPTVVVNAGTFTYDGTPHSATGSVTGIGGEALGEPALTYNGNVDAPADAGAYQVVGIYGGGANYEAASGSATLTINKATPVVNVTGGTFTYDGAEHQATGTVTGVGGATLQSPRFTYNGSSEAPRNAGIYDVVAHFDGAANYTVASATTTLTIGQATPAVNVESAMYTFDGNGHPAVGYVTGVPGEAPGPLSFTYNGSTDVPVNGGSYTVTASFAGSTNYVAATGTGTIVITKATPSVTVSGGAFTYDGTPHPATGSATGVGGSNLSGLTFTYNGSSAAPVNAGSYDVVGTFAESTNYLAGSATTTITINRASPTLSWNQPGAIVYGTALGASQLSASSSVAGSFSYSPVPGTVLPAGAGRPLAATFTPADAANYIGGSLSSTIDVNPAALVVRPNDAVKPFGAPVPAFSATYSGFVNGDTAASLAGTLGMSTTANAGSPVGAYSIVPAGVSSPNYTIAFVNGTLSVVRAAVGVSVSSTPQPSGLDQPMTFTALVSAVPPGAGSPTGTVRFFDGTTLLGSVALASASASLTTAGLPAGLHTIEARYDGDGSFAPGSGTATHAVNSAAGTPTVALSSSRNPANIGQSVTLTAAVSMSGNPLGGVVQFYDGGVPLGSATISAGQARLTTTAFTAGSHAITARYAESADVPPVLSGVLVQSITDSGWKNRTTSLTLSASPNPAPLGSSVVFTATVTGSTGTMPGGRVLFMVNGQVAGNAAGEVIVPTSGSVAHAVLSVPGLAHGHHRVTTTYLGDSTYKGSTATLSLTVD
jgi:hypothetical protein